MLAVSSLMRWHRATWGCWLRRGLLIGTAGLLLAAGLILWSDRMAVEAGEGVLYDDVGAIPEAPVALVFGCNRLVNGRPNLYFKYRIEAAAELWRAGKVKCLIVSGDHHVEDYNEPEDMKLALIEAGVPKDRIVCDFAGFRTLDSVVRAKKVFGASEVVFVSQKFHNERAAYLARSIGLKASGLNARAVGGQAGRKTDYREKLARVKMWLDVNLLGTEPKFLGKEELPL